MTDDLEKLDDMMSEPNNRRPGQISRTRMALTKSWRSSLIIGSLYGCLAIAYWILWIRGDQHGLTPFLAIVWSIFSLIYFISSATIRHRKRHPNDPAN